MKETQMCYLQSLDETNKIENMKQKYINNE